jgi:hypothetical protein
MLAGDAGLASGGVRRWRWHQVPPAPPPSPVQSDPLSFAWNYAAAGSIHTNNEHT